MVNNDDGFVVDENEQEALEAAASTLWILARGSASRSQETLKP